MPVLVAGGGGLVSRQIVIDCGGTPAFNPAQTAGWAAVLAATSGGAWWAFNSDGVQGRSASWDFVSEAGTYEIDFYHLTGPVKGIYSFAIDGVALATTIDGYRTTFDYTFDHIPPGIGPGNTVLRAGQHTITITMNTKNAASTQFAGEPVKIVFTRSS